MEMLKGQVQHFVNRVCTDHDHKMVLKLSLRWLETLVVAWVEHMGVFGPGLLAFVRCKTKRNKRKT